MENEKQGIQLVKIKMVDDAFLDLGERVTGTDKAFQAGLKTIAKEVGSFDREVLFALNLNNKNQIINANIVTMGTINSSLFSPRDIFKSAILSNAAKVILYHNHPSGDLTPSIADIQSTQRAIEAGKYIGIEVLDHIISNQKGEMLSLREEADRQFLNFDEIENLTIREIKEEASLSETYSIDKIIEPKPSNLEKFQVLSRRKDYLKLEKDNIFYDVLGLVDTSKIDSEIKKIDMVINNLLSKEQKEHIIEFLKTQGEGEHVKSVNNGAYWNEIYYGEIPLLVKMVDEDFFMGRYKAWSNFLIKEFEKGNVSWDSLINAGYEPTKEIEFYKNHEKNIDNQPIYRKVIAIEEKSNTNLIFEVRKHELPKLYLLDSSDKVINVFKDWNTPLYSFGNYFFEQNEFNPEHLKYAVDEIQSMPKYKEYKFNTEPEQVLYQNVLLENKIILPTLSEEYKVEEPKTTYSIKTKEQKEAELKQLADNIQTKVNEFVMNPEIIKDYLLFKRQFREYSMNNTILIYSERPDALGVGTYKFWQKKGHPVKRGEKGIGIYAPILKDYIVDSAGHPVSRYEEATPEQLQKLASKEYSKHTVPVGFTKKYVFDITQTSTPIEDYPKLIKEGYELDNKNDYQVQNIAINRLVGKSGLKLIDYDKARTGKSAQGYFIPATKEIYLQPDLTSIARFKTLVHETAHGILHGVKNNLTTGEKEFQAQMVSLVVSDTLGLPMKDGDYGYVKNYQRDITDERKRELLDGVFKVADLVLESYEETLELIKANELSIEEKQEIERLQLDLPTLSKTDIQEIIHYPSTEQQKYFLATKIIKKNVENMSVEEKENYYKEAEAFLRNKIEKNHKHYQVGLLNEATLTRREDNKLELVFTNIKGNSEKQVFDEEEQVVELLSKKEAVPVSENAMVYTKNKVENKLGQEKQLERTQQQVRERGL